MLPLIRPKSIVTAGSKAKEVIADSLARSRISDIQKKIWRFPSLQAMSRISGMFGTGDLLSRFPEVARVAESNLNWIMSGNKRNKAFFACHAVSLEEEGTA